MMVETKLATSGRVGQEFDIFDALPQLVEGGMAAIEHGAPVFGELDAVRIALQQTHPEGMLQICHRFCHHRIRDGKLFRRLGHASTLHDCEKDMQIAQLEPTSDTLAPFHAAV